MPKNQGPVEGRSFGGSLVPQHDGYFITREAFWQIANQLEWVQHHLALTPSALWKPTGEGSDWSPGWGGAASSPSCCRKAGRRGGAGQTERRPDLARCAKPYPGHLAARTPKSGRSARQSRRRLRARTGALFGLSTPSRVGAI